MERALPFLDKKFALKTFYHSASISEISSSIISSYRQNIDFILKDNKSFIDFVWRINTTTNHVYKGDTAPVRYNFKETFENIYAIEEENIRYLCKLKQLCEEKGVQLIFIRSPGLKHLQSKNESILMHMKKTFFPNIPFLDFRKYPLDIKLFADEQHLNRNGKNKFTRFFNDSIAQERLSDIDKLKRIIQRNSIAR